NRQKKLEMAGIFDRELPGEPIFTVIVEEQSCLEAGTVVRCYCEVLRRQAQLERVGQILSIEYGDELAARKLQRVIEGLGLGLRPASGNDDHFHMIGKLLVANEL